MSSRVPSKPSVDTEKAHTDLPQASKKRKRIVDTVDGDRQQAKHSVEHSSRSDSTSQLADSQNLMSQEMQLVFSQITGASPSSCSSIEQTQLLLASHDLAIPSSATASINPSSSTSGALVPVAPTALTGSVSQPGTQSQAKSAPQRKNVPFTKEEDDMLMKAVTTAHAQKTKVNWPNLSHLLQRSIYLCEQRFKKLTEPSKSSASVPAVSSTAGNPSSVPVSSNNKEKLSAKRKDPFTTEEDEQLWQAVSERGANKVNWTQLSQTLNRSIYQCKHRWLFLSERNKGVPKTATLDNTSQSVQDSSHAVGTTSNSSATTPIDTSPTTITNILPTNSSSSTSNSTSISNSNSTSTATDTKPKKPPSREFTREEIIVILQAGHDAVTANRHMRWVALSKKLNCSVRDCENQWSRLQTARKRAAKAMVLLGTPVLPLIPAVSQSSSSNGSSSSVVSSAVVRSGAFDSTVAASSSIEPVSTDSAADSGNTSVAPLVPTKRKYTKRLTKVSTDGSTEVTTMRDKMQLIIDKATLEVSSSSEPNSTNPITSSSVTIDTTSSVTSSSSIAPISSSTTSATSTSVTTSVSDPTTSTARDGIDNDILLSIPPPIKPSRRFTTEEDALIVTTIATAQIEGTKLIWADIGRQLNRRGEVCQQRWNKFLAPGAGSSTAIKSTTADQEHTTSSDGAINESNNPTVQDTKESKFPFERRQPRAFTEHDDVIITQAMELAYTENRRIRWPNVAAELMRTTHACKQRWHATLFPRYSEAKGSDYEKMSPVLRAVVQKKPGAKGFSAVEDFTILCRYDRYKASHLGDASIASSGAVGSTNANGSSSSSSSSSSCNNNSSSSNTTPALQPLWNSLSSQLRRAPDYIAERCAKLLSERDGTAKLTTLWTIYNQACTIKNRRVFVHNEVRRVVDCLASAVTQKTHNQSVRNINAVEKKPSTTEEGTDVSTSRKKPKLPDVSITTALVVPTTTIPSTTTTNAAYGAVSAVSAATTSTTSTTTNTTAKTQTTSIPPTNKRKKITTEGIVVTRNIHDNLTYDSDSSESSDSIDDGVVNSAKPTITRNCNATRDKGSSGGIESSNISDSSDSSSDSSDEECKLSAVTALAPTASAVPKRKSGGHHSPDRKKGCPKTDRKNRNFTIEEDALIVQAAQAGSDGRNVNWPALGKSLGRMGCICRRRWVRHLSKRDEAALIILRDMKVELPLAGVPAVTVGNSVDADGSGHIFASSSGSSAVSSNVVSAGAFLDNKPGDLRTRAPRRTFTDMDDAHILNAVRTAEIEGVAVRWRLVGTPLGRTGDACKQRWRLTLAPRHPELKKI